MTGPNGDYGFSSISAVQINRRILRKEEYKYLNNLQMCVIIAIFYPNFDQVGKGRDRKTGFCRVRHKKCQAKDQTFSCQTL